MEEGKFLPEALEILSGVKSPLYGVPGNHDYWSKMPFNDIIKCFAATGGAWLVDEKRVIAGGKINLGGHGPSWPRTSVAFRRSRKEKHFTRALPRVGQAVGGAKI